ARIGDERRRYSVLISAVLRESENRQLLTCRRDKPCNAQFRKPLSSSSVVSFCNRFLSSFSPENVCGNVIGSQRRKNAVESSSVTSGIRFVLKISLAWLMKLNGFLNLCSAVIGSPPVSILKIPTDRSAVSGRSAYRFANLPKRSAFANLLISSSCNPREETLLIPMRALSRLMYVDLPLLPSPANKRAFCAG